MGKTITITVCMIICIICTITLYHLETWDTLIDINKNKSFNTSKKIKVQMSILKNTSFDIGATKKL